MWLLLKCSDSLGGAPKEKSCQPIPRLVSKTQSPPISSKPSRTPPLVPEFELGPVPTPKQSLSFHQSYLSTTRTPTALTWARYQAQATPTSAHIVPLRREVRALLGSKGGDGICGSSSSTSAPWEEHMRRSHVSQSLGSYPKP